MRNYSTTQVAQPFLSRPNRVGNTQQFHKRVETDSVSGKCVGSRNPAGLIVHFVRVFFPYWLKLLMPTSNCCVGMGRLDEGGDHEQKSHWARPHKLLENAYYLCHVLPQMYECGSHWTDFCEIWGLLRKSVKKHQIWLK